jgi:hypothetical protein
MTLIIVWPSIARYSLALYPCWTDSTHLTFTFQISLTLLKWPPYTWPPLFRSHLLWPPLTWPSLFSYLTSAHVTSTHMPFTFQLISLTCAHVTSTHLPFTFQISFTLHLLLWPPLTWPSLFRSHLPYRCLCDLHSLDIHFSDLIYLTSANMTCTQLTLTFQILFTLHLLMWPAITWPHFSDLIYLTSAHLTSTHLTFTFQISFTLHLLMWPPLTWPSLYRSHLPYICSCDLHWSDLHFIDLIYLTSAHVTSTHLAFTL